MLLYSADSVKNHIESAENNILYLADSNVFCIFAAKYKRNESHNWKKIRG